MNELEYSDQKNWSMVRRGVDNSSTGNVTQTKDWTWLISLTSQPTERRNVLREELLEDTLPVGGKLSRELTISGNGGAGGQTSQSPAANRGANLPVIRRTIWKPYDGATDSNTYYSLHTT